MSTSLMKRLKICTKAEYLAIEEKDPDIRYFITNMPGNSINNEDMALAITTEAELYSSGDIYICSDSGTYLKGHIYQLNNAKTVWVDISLTASDIIATNSQTVQQNLERIDTEIEDIIDNFAPQKYKPLTVAPTSDNPNPETRIVVELTSEPVVYYDGYDYIIVES